MTHAATATARPLAATWIDGLSAIAPRYDAFVIDLWGVLHDGAQTYPGAVPALGALKAAGKRVLLLSNAPRRIDTVVEKLDELAVPRACYDDVMSSGEATHRALRDRSDPFHAALGDRCFHLGPPRDASIHHGLSIAVVDRVEEASFILATGFDRRDETVADYEPVLAAGAARNLPLVCANPDLSVIAPGRREPCAGALAARYAELGGPVFHHGKPHAPIYRVCFDLLGDVPRDRVLAIGDGLYTDVLGAGRAGIDCAFVTGGVHAEALGIPAGAAARPDAVPLAALCAEIGAHPRWAMAALTW
jgi:HAD superfamily hydrolase (TIGR01459 family)